MAGARACAGALTKIDFRGRAYDGIFGAIEATRTDLRRLSFPLPPPLLLLPLLPEADDDEVAEGGAAAAASLLRLPVEFVVLMLLALISESPAAAAGIFFIADDGTAAPEFSLAEAESLAFFCCSHDWSSSSRDRFLFLGCMIM